MRSSGDGWRQVVVAVLAALVLVPPMVTGAAGAATSAWQLTGRMGVMRSGHTATLLADGTVLVAGGAGSNGATERYDPRTGAWRRAGTMGTGRVGHTAIVLSDGSALVVGGSGNLTGNHNGESLALVERYDPATDTWRFVAGMSTPREGQTATLLRDGTVLVAGGFNGRESGLATAERYDPGTNTWRPTGGLLSGRALHSATLLADGTVLVVGGGNNRGQAFLTEAERYDPATGTWRPAGTLGTARAAHTATLLPDGTVLVVGGTDGTAGLASSDLYDARTDSWRTTAGMSTGRADFTATLLPDGTVLAAGGTDSNNIRSWTAERYTADAPTTPGLPNTGGGGARDLPPPAGWPLFLTGGLLLLGGLSRQRARP